MGQLTSTCAPNVKLVTLDESTKVDSRIIIIFYIVHGKPDLLGFRYFGNNNNNTFSYISYLFEKSNDHLQQTLFFHRQIYHSLIIYHYIIVIYKYIF